MSLPQNTIHLFIDKGWSCYKAPFMFTDWRQCCWSFGPLVFFSSPRSTQPQDDLSLFCYHPNLVAAALRSAASFPTCLVAVGFRSSAGLWASKVRRVGARLCRRLIRPTCSIFSSEHPGGLRLQTASGPIKSNYYIEHGGVHYFIGPLTLPSNMLPCHRSRGLGPGTDGLTVSSVRYGWLSHPRT